MYLHLTPVGQARRRFITKMATEIRRRTGAIDLAGKGREGRGKLAWEELQQCSSYLQSQGRAAHMAAAGRVKLKAPHAPILPRTNCCEILLVGHSQEERFLNQNLGSSGRDRPLCSSPHPTPRGKRPTWTYQPTNYGEEFLVVFYLQR